MPQPAAIVFLLVPAMLAGCLVDDADTARDRVSPVLGHETGHVLVGAMEPDAITAPTFETFDPIATDTPFLGGGEPSVWADPNGGLHIAFPGCNRSLVDNPMTPVGCGHGPVFRSHMDGAEWEWLNDASTGRYTEEGPAANGDADIAVDAAGNLYATNLGNGIQFHTRWAHNDTWQYMANVVPEEESADRQWIAAGKEGHAIVAWMRMDPARDVEINVTFDGGLTWQHAGNYGTPWGGVVSNGIGWLGSVQIAPDGEHAYIPYTQPLGGGEPTVNGGGPCAMHVLVSADGGRTWADVDTGARWTTTHTGTHWSCVHMAPSLDVTGDGSVVIAYSRDTTPVAGVNGQSVPSIGPVGQQIDAIISRDGGFTWTEPEWIGPRNAAVGLAPATGIMPWVTGGGGDRFAITYLYTPTLTDQDYAAATWDVRVMVVDGLGDEEPVIVDAPIEEGVHAGGICTRGGMCLLTASDRSFLDFFESDVLPDGRLFVAYPHDLNPKKNLEIRYAIQEAGSPLFETADA